MAAPDPPEEVLEPSAYVLCENSSVGVVSCIATGSTRVLTIRARAEQSRWHTFPQPSNIFDVHSIDAFKAASDIQFRCNQTFWKTLGHIVLGGQADRRKSLEDVFETATAMLQEWSGHRHLRVHLQELNFMSRWSGYLGQASSHRR